MYNNYNITTNAGSTWTVVIGGATQIEEYKIKIAIIDVDNILHPFHKQLYKILKGINNEIPHYSTWEWDFFTDYVSLSQFRKVVNIIHSMQIDLRPFPYAKEFLETVKKSGYIIIIASDRNSKHKDSLKLWLDKYKLSYDEIHTTSNKCSLIDSRYVLMDECQYILVDDSPLTLEKALKLKNGNNIYTCGLKYPWNEHLLDKVVLTPDLLTLKTLLVLQGVLNASV